MSTSAASIPTSVPPTLEKELAAVESKISAIEFVLGIGGENYEIILVKRFQEWNQGKLREYLLLLYDEGNELRRTKNILLESQSRVAARQ